MSLKAKVEAVIYAAEEPVTLEQLALLLKDIVLADLASAQENAAIEQADSAAEAAAAASEEGDFLPEFASPAADLISPEPGPLMPEPEAPMDVEPRQDTAVRMPGEGDRIEAGKKEIPEQSAIEGLAPCANTSPVAEASVSGESVSEESGLNAAAGVDDSINNASVDNLSGKDVPVSIPEEPAPAESASVEAPETTSRKRQPKKTDAEIAEEKAVRARIRVVLVELITDYAHEDRGMEIRQVAGGFRMATKPEHHDVVRAFAKSLKPPIRLSLAALETLAVIAYKQPITAPEIADIRGVESASVLGTLLDRKLITTAGRKQVIGRPMQYKTSKDFLLRFGLNDVNELPSMEEFSQLASDGTIEIAPAELQDIPSLFEPEPQDIVPPDAAAFHVKAESQSPPQSKDDKDVESLDAEPKTLEENDQGSPVSESQPPDAAEPADSQPQSEAESSNVPEAEHPIGRR